MSDLTQLNQLRLNLCAHRNSEFRLNDRLHASTVSYDIGTTYRRVADVRDLIRMQGNFRPKFKRG